ncbi:uncharacterized protein F4807DRAFT_353623 [Annulohypoxylon truncatum]|uniref:uncharacterized protein n=1 Tax=Annulohypoxylon truncatum TaxID=327061 RepID=UPI002008AACE|nr:uncharacterized protein F4807DRAFT_353623 [Annulohypoxylon truncatum]KAI1204295.1 hypothetical protein F4807DRAFT_353623 [Annulohypoxylon truncatum]
MAMMVFWSLGACLTQVKPNFASPVLGTLIETSVLSKNMCWGYLPMVDFLLGNLKKKKRCSIVVRGLGSLGLTSSQLPLFTRI